MTLEELYDIASEIPEKLKLTNKYTFLISIGIIEGRLININKTFEHKTPINGYVQKYVNVLLLPNIVNGKIIDMVAQPLEGGGNPLTLGKAKLSYNIGAISDDFKYGDPLFIVEGIADLGALKLIKKDLNIVALRTNTIPKSQISFYAALTNNIVFIPDNDKAGKSQISWLKHSLAKHSTDLSIIQQYGELKDTGDIVDITMKYLKTNDSSIKQELEAINQYYLFSINSY